MGFSYQGIGEWCASFACGSVAEGAVVKMNGNGTVAACGAGDAFCGVVRALAHDGNACSVQLGGMAKVAYSGSAPEAGFVKLAADANGGVSANANGAGYLVAEVDETAHTLTIRL